MDTLSESIDDLASEDAGVREAAGRALDAAIPLIRPEAFSELERRLRSSTCRCYNWVNLQKEWVLPKQWPAAAWAMYSMHRNGYLREAAVRLLSADTSIKFALPFLLLRLNDWVAPVRDAAFAGVRSLLNVRMLERWSPLLGLIESLRDRTCVDHSQLFDELIQFYLQPESETTLRAAITQPDRKSARAAFAISMRLGDDRRDSFIVAGLQAADPEVRRMAAVAVRGWSKCPNREVRLATMFADRYMPVRRQALLARIEVTGEKRRGALLAALLDSHRTMRQLGQFYLSRDDVDSPKLDIRGYYINALRETTPRALKAAILGLAETGTAADAELLNQFVKGSLPSVAAAAVEGVASRAREANLEFFEALMVDPRPCVVRRAAAALIKQYCGFSVERLRVVVRNGPSSTSRRWALRVLTSRHPFEAFADIVLAVNHDDPAVQELALARARAVSSIYRIPRGPNDAELKAIRMAIQSQTSPLPPELATIIHWYIGL